MSAHDLITLCRLEPQNQTYSAPKATTQSSHSDNRGSDNGGSVNRDFDGNILLFKTPAKSKSAARPKAVVVDIRSYEEFRLGHTPGAISVPHDTTFLPDGSLVSQASAKLKNIPRGRVIIVVGGKGEAAPTVSHSCMYTTC